MLTNSSTGDYSTLQNSVTTSSPKSAKTLRNYTYGKSASQSIVIRFGGLDWIVTYLSVSDVDSDGDGNNDIIATLWLTNNEQDAWQSKSTTAGSLGKYYGFLRSSETGKIGLYADWSANWHDNNSPEDFPSNMYSTSYMATVVLNNGRHYATDYQTLVPATTDSNGFGVNNPFYSFTTPVNGEINDLTDFIVTPNKVSWQQTIQDESLIDFGNHCSNDSLDNTGGNYYLPDNNYSSKTYYSAWGNDYLWLPSLVEVGHSDSYDGIWETIASERMNYDGIRTSNLSSGSGTIINSENTSGDIRSCAWLRSASRSRSNEAIALDDNGSGYVNNSCAVRPALHLNLKTLSESMSVTITLNQQSGSNGTTSINVKKGKSLPTITLPTRSGFAFGGYFTSTNGSGTKYYNADGTSAINYPASGGATTLYAYWQQLYTLTTTANNTSLGKTFGTGSYIAGASITIHASAEIGYTFAYWSVTNSSGTEITKLYQNEYTLTMPTYNITYTAIFVKAIDGINICSTYGGMVAMVGDNFESLSNSDTITLVATVCVTGYQFKHWINQDGTILASGEDNKTFLIQKSQAMNSIITAVFEPIT